MKQWLTSWPFKPFLLYMGLILNRERTVDIIHTGTHICSCIDYSKNNTYTYSIYIFDPLDHQDPRLQIFFPKMLFFFQNHKSIKISFPQIFKVIFLIHVWKWKDIFSKGIFFSQQCFNKCHLTPDPASKFPCS